MIHVLPLPLRLIPDPGKKEAAARVVRIFPDDASLVRLASALPIERSRKWMERRCLTIAEAPPSETELRKSA